MQTPVADVTYAPAPGQEAAPEPPWYRGRRLVTFVIVTAVVLATGLTYVHSRPPVYRASASVLTTELPAVDAGAAAADSQHAAVEAARLMADPVLVRVANALVTAGMNDPPGVAELRQVLTVEVVPNTHLVELQATASAPGRVKDLVDAWVASYLEFRARDVSSATGDTIERLKARATALETQVEAKRTELAAYRERHEILSLTQDQNQLPARMKGLTSSLNKANERVVNAEARLGALRDAEARGELVAPRGDRAELIALKKRLDRSQTRLAEVEARFTTDYIAIDPKLTALKEKVSELEEEMASRAEAARETAFTNARLELDEARATVRSLQSRIDSLKARRAEYSARFAEHEALREDLKDLEALHREARSRVAAIAAENRPRYPQVEVLRPAVRPAAPVSPDYARDSLVALAAALLLGLLATIMVEFLAPRRRETAGPQLTGIRVYLDGAEPRATLDRPDSRQSITHEP